MSAPVRTRGRRAFFRGPSWSLLSFLLLFCALFFGLSWLVSPEPDVTAAPAVAVTDLDGRDVVVVAYSRDGPRGMFQLIFQPMFQSRLAAIDAATGDPVWDVRLDEELGSGMRVLAAADGFVYVASDEGLYIRSLADGSVVAQPEAIPGLGDTYVADLGSYDVDPERRLVVAIDEAGDLWEIPFGSAEAVPARETTAGVWQSVLADDFRFALDLPDTADDVSLGGGATLTVEPTKQGARTEALIVWEHGTSRQLGDATFLDPSLIVDGGAGVRALDPPRAAGDGYVLVASTADEGDGVHRLSAVDRATGEVLDIAGELGYEIGGGYSGDGVTALTAQSPGDDGDLLVVVTDDGTMAMHRIGLTNFFGLPA